MRLFTALKRKYTDLKNGFLIKYGKKPKVLSIDETLDYILKNKCSVSRFGDGELQLAMNKSMYLQTKSEGLSKALCEILRGGADTNHIVCLLPVFDYNKLYTEESKKYSKSLLLMNRKRYLKFIDCKKTYHNANITRPYMIYKDKSKAPAQIKKWKQLWANKNVLIVEGEKTRFGVGNDLLSTVSDIRRILCPSNNAFDKYDEILNASVEHGKDKVVLIALGATATVLAYDLSKHGVFAIDIGHLDIEYEWMLRGVTEKCEIKGKYSTGKFTETQIAEFPEYTNSIIKRIE